MATKLYRPRSVFPACTANVFSLTPSPLQKAASAAQFIRHPQFLPWKVLTEIRAMSPCCPKVSKAMAAVRKKWPGFWSIKIGLFWSPKRVRLSLCCADICGLWGMYRMLSQRWTLWISAARCRMMITSSACLICLSLPPPLSPDTSCTGSCLLLGHLTVGVLLWIFFFCVQSL